MTGKPPGAVPQPCCPPRSETAGSLPMPRRLLPHASRAVQAADQGARLCGRWARGSLCPVVGRHGGQGMEVSQPRGNHSLCTRVWHEQEAVGAAPLWLPLCGCPSWRPSSRPPPPPTSIPHPHPPGLSSCGGSRLPRRFQGEPLRARAVLHRHDGRAGAEGLQTFPHLVGGLGWVNQAINQLHLQCRGSQQRYHGTGRGEEGV